MGLRIIFGQHKKDTHRRQKPYLQPIQRILAISINTKQRKLSRIRNAKVGGSIPLSGTNRFKHLAQSLRLGFLLCEAAQPAPLPSCTAVRFSKKSASSTAFQIRTIASE